MEETTPIIARAEPDGLSYTGIPEVISINYDLYVLRIDLQFENIEGPVYVEFEGVQGLRMLDEGDLQEFWKEGVCSGSWLFTIEQGGWFDLERKRSGFISSPRTGLKEYMIAGINDCINVISYDGPVIRKPKP